MQLQMEPGGHALLCHMHILRVKLIGDKGFDYKYCHDQVTIAIVL